MSEKIFENFHAQLKAILSLDELDTDNDRKFLSRPFSTNPRTTSHNAPERARGGLAAKHPEPQANTFSLIADRRPSSSSHRLPTQPQQARHMPPPPALPLPQPAHQQHQQQALRRQLARTDVYEGSDSTDSQSKRQTQAWGGDRRRRFYPRRKCDKKFYDAKDTLSHSNLPVPRNDINDASNRSDLQFSTASLPVPLLENEDEISSVSQLSSRQKRRQWYQRRQRQRAQRWQQRQQQLQDQQPQGQQNLVIGSSGLEKNRSDSACQASPGEKATKAAAAAAAAKSIPDDTNNYAHCQNIPHQQSTLRNSISLPNIDANAYALRHCNSFPSFHRMPSVERIMLEETTSNRLNDSRRLHTSRLSGLNPNRESSFGSMYSKYNQSVMLPLLSESMGTLNAHYSISESSENSNDRSNQSGLALDKTLPRGQSRLSLQFPIRVDLPGLQKNKNQEVSCDFSKFSSHETEYDRQMQKALNGNDVAQILKERKTREYLEQFSLSSTVDDSVVPEEYGESDELKEIDESEEIDDSEECEQLEDSERAEESEETENFENSKGTEESEEANKESSKAEANVESGRGDATEEQRAERKPDSATQVDDKADDLKLYTCCDIVPDASRVAPRVSSVVDFETLQYAFWKRKIGHTDTDLLGKVYTDEVVECMMSKEDSFGSQDMLWDARTSRKMIEERDAIVARYIGLCALNLDLSPATIFLGVFYGDNYYLRNKNEKAQGLRDPMIVYTASLIMATRYEEMRVPSRSSILFCLGFPEGDESILIDYEDRIMKALDYQMNRYTIETFLRRLMKFEYAPLPEPRPSSRGQQGLHKQQQQQQQQHRLTYPQRQAYNPRDQYGNTQQLNQRQNSAELRPEDFPALYFQQRDLMQQRQLEQQLKRQERNRVMMRIAYALLANYEACTAARPSALAAAIAHLAAPLTTDPGQPSSWSSSYVERATGYSRGAIARLLSIIEKKVVQETAHYARAAKAAAARQKVVFGAADPHCGVESMSSVELQDLQQRLARLYVTPPATAAPTPPLLLMPTPDSASIAWVRDGRAPGVIG